MQRNVGSLDSTIRVGLGFASLFAAFLLPPPASAVAYALCLVLAVTGFTGKCLAYRVLGIDTCEKAG
jgi:hypothetical protein